MRNLRQKMQQNIHNRFIWTTTKFFEEEVFSILDETSFDKVIIVGDGNVFLDPTKDQENYINYIKSQNKGSNKKQY